MQCWWFCSLAWKALLCTSPPVKKNEEKRQLFRYIPSIHSVDKTHPNPNKPKWAGLPWSLWQVAPLIISNANLSCKSCSWRYYGCSCPCWNSAHPARWQVFPLLLLPKGRQYWGLDSLLRLPGWRQTSMKREASKLWLAPLCTVYRQGKMAGQAQNGGKTWDKA